MKRHFRKLTALMLVIAMAVSLFPAALAAGQPATEEVLTPETPLASDSEQVTVSEAPAALAEEGSDVPEAGNDVVYTIESDAMSVQVDQTFPRVIQYTLKDGKTMAGQKNHLDTIGLNYELDPYYYEESIVEVQPQVTSVQAEAGGAVVYTLLAQDEESGIDVTITVKIEVEDNILTVSIPDLVYNNNDRLDNPVESILFPDHSLVSVDSKQKGAQFVSSIFYDYYANTTYDCDKVIDLEGITSVKDLGNNRYAFMNKYTYAFLSGNGLSAGIFTNSESGGVFTNDRIKVFEETKDETVTVGLYSNIWYYDRRVSSSDDDPAQTVGLTKEQSIVGPTETPYVKVVITEDQNGDDVVDWQDGAIAARESGALHIPAYSQNMADKVSTRIAMNFGSQAQNPFLTTLDNVKRVALHTDGLGQAVLLKGYAGEGHDSNHPDYDNVGQRMGGLEDMKTLMQEGKKLGASFGIHINTSEFYPESKAFNEDLIRYDDEEHTQVHYGWNWLDQGIAMNGPYDLASGSRQQRLDDLFKAVGNDLDFVYVDVWGNSTSGPEDAWQTRKLSKQITDHGWRIVHEWAGANEWDSTFQHWVSDYSYGGADSKGYYNSAVARFMLNRYKDSFAPDFPTYGGVCNAPLLGGTVMQGFEGWQGDVEYNQAIDTIYDQMIPTKFLQHYNVMKWVDATEKVALPYKSSYDEAGSMELNWRPEVQLTLQDDDRANTVVVTRGTDGEIDETYSYETEADQLNYRSRYITLNGNVILQGAADPGEFIYDHAPHGDMSYLIPWFWDNEGNTVANDDLKLYHYNLKGGETTWTLPKECADWASVKVYELTDQGRVNEKTVNVVDGKVTLTADAKIPYVVVKGESGAQAPTVEWSTGMHLTDVSFNGKLSDSWTVAGAAETVYTENGNPMLKLAGEGSVSQALTDLKAGQSYAVYVGVDNRSDAKALLTIKDSDGAVVASNYTLRSIAQNFISAYSHSNIDPTEDGVSCFQNMYVFFTPEAGKTYTLTLSREAGAGNSYFDDVRVVENASKNFTYDEEGNFVSFTQDFEHVAQGEYPFVVGPAEDVADNCQHLAEKHAPYTQAGWMAKKTDDVLEGDWSLKANAMVEYDDLIYQTIPQNIHFEADQIYTVSFDYQMGSPKIYEVVWGSGEYDPDNQEGLWRVSLEEALGETKTCTFTLKGDLSGQTWFGIYSTDMAPDYKDAATDDEEMFGGYGDIMLDNLKITVGGDEPVREPEPVPGGELLFHASFDADDRTETAVKDASGNDHDGTIHGELDFVPGVQGDAVQFGAENGDENAVNYIDFGTDMEDTFASGMFTLSYWFKAGTDATADSVILGNTDANDFSDMGLNVSYAPNGIYASNLRGKRALAGMDDLMAVDGEWHHVVIAVTDYGRGMETYLDGVDTNQGWDDEDGDAARNDILPLVIGADGKFQYGLTDCLVDEVRIYSEPMDEDAVKALYTAEGYAVETAKMLAFLDGVIPGARFSEKQVSDMRDKVTAAQAKLAKDGDPAEIMGALREDYLAFLEGNKPEGKVLVVSDVHISDSSSPYNRFVTGLKDMKEVAPDAIAMLNAGDFSDNSKESQFKTFYKAMEEYSPVTPDKAVIIMGNHDVRGEYYWNDDPEYPEDCEEWPDIKANYLEMNAPYMPEDWDGESLYFSKELGGYTFIGLNTELGLKDVIYMTDEYIAWLEETIKTAYEAHPDRPIFIVSHQALNNTHPDTDTYLFCDETRDEDARVKEIMAKYPNVIFLSGHVHNGFGHGKDMYRDFGVAVDLPSYNVPEGRGYSKRGAGYVMYIYSDEVVFRARNFRTSEWLPQYDISIRLPDLAASYAKAQAVEGTGKDTAVQAALDKTTPMLSEDNDPFYYQRAEVRAALEEQRQALLTVSDLSALYDEVKDTEQGKYSDSSWAAFQTALAEAKAVLDDVDFTSAQAKEAKSALETAHSKLSEFRPTAPSASTGKNPPKEEPEEPSYVDQPVDELPFEDVDKESWYAQSVANIYAKGYMKGTGETTFAPEMCLNRGMMAQILYNVAANPSVSAELTFADVSDQYYADAVAWAVANGVLKGYNDDEFGGEDNVTREQVVVTLYRYAQSLKEDVETDPAALDGFTDSGDISDWATDAMAWAVKTGIIQGRGNNDLAPLADITRAEMATIMNRFASQFLA